MNEPSLQDNGDDHRFLLSQVNEVCCNNETWPQLIWREWRNCEDETYASQLFNLVVNRPTDAVATIVLAGLGALLGAFGGGLWYWLLAWSQASSRQLGLGVGLGLLLGGLSGVLANRLLLRFNRMTWGDWLQGVSPTYPWLDRPDRRIDSSLYLGLVGGLGSGIGVGVPGLIFFAQPHRQIWPLLVGLAGLFITSVMASRRTALIGLGIGLLVGLPFGLFFGLGLAQIVGLLVGPFDVPDSARAVGLGVGLGAGLLLGRWTGLLGALLWQGVATLLVVIAGPNLVLLGWLVGLLGGGVLGSISRWWSLPAGQLELAEIYRYRTLLVWWAKRPPAAALEAALRRHTAGEPWLQLLRRLEAQRQQAHPFTGLVSRLHSESWTDRFIARHTLVSLGHEALRYLLALAGDSRSSQRQTARWLARSIGHETTDHLAGRARQMICPACLTGCGSYAIREAGLSITYYGCRTCGQSREFLHCPQGVVAVLDTGWTEASPRRGGWLHWVFGTGSGNPPELKKQAQDGGQLRVNWLAHRQLFDFDRVAIVRATDEEVERFAVQVGNDTDPVRQPHYRQMQCVVGPEARLSENTRRILERAFGKVESIKWNE